jgi:hypothetical protein
MNVERLISLLLIAPYEETGNSMYNPNNIEAQLFTWEKQCEDCDPDDKVLYNVHTKIVIGQFLADTYFPVVHFQGSQSQFILVDALENQYIFSLVLTVGTLLATIPLPTP